MAILRKLSLCYSIVYYCGAQRYEQFIQVGRPYWGLVFLGLALYHLSTSISWCYMHSNFLVTFFLYLLAFSLVGLECAHCPSVL